MKSFLIPILFVIEKRNLLFVAILFALLHACDTLPTNSKESKEDNPLLEKTYYDNGKLRNYVELDSAKNRHGLSKSYSPEGIITKEFLYEHGAKTKAISYHSTGQPLLELYYKDGLKHGVRKKYRNDGTLESELEYFEGRLTTNLKEYTKSGKLKTKYPKLIIQTKDEISTKGLYTVEVFFEKNASRGDYYYGELTDGKIVPETMIKLDEKNKKGVHVYNMLPGSFRMETLYFIGVFKTSTGNKKVKEIKYNVAIENPI